MLLAIDLGQYVGWIKGNAVGPVSHGTIDLTSTPRLGLWLKNLDPHIPELLWGVTAIVIEQPFMGRDYYPIRKLLALLGYINRHAEDAGIRTIKEYAISTGKKALSGSGAADGPQMIAAAERRGYPGLNEHEAHALGLFWVFHFGPAEDPPKKPRSSKGVIIPTTEAN